MDPETSAMKSATFQHKVKNQMTEITIKWIDVVINFFM